MEFKTLAVFMFFIILSMTSPNAFIFADSWTNPSISKIRFDFTVAKDGSGSHMTVQEAVTAAPDNSGKRIYVLVKAGTYREVITVPATKPNICLIGEDASKTILTFDNYSGRKKPAY